MMGPVNLIQPRIFRACYSQNIGFGTLVADCLANAIKTSVDAAGDVSRQL